MTVQIKTALGLKEWGAVIDAMESGRQFITLRKGGVREKSFLVEGRSFYLLPTFEHQSAELVKPEFGDSVERALAEQRDPSGLIVRLRADVAGLWEIEDQRRLEALNPYQMFTPEYAQTRFSWRPKQPLTVLLLRAFRLTQPWYTGLPSGVGGCRSWLEIDAASAPTETAPVLSDEEFYSVTSALRKLLD
jgi:hypothetical protein